MEVETRVIRLAKEGRVPYYYNSYYWVAQLPPDITGMLRLRNEGKRYLNFHYKVNSAPPYYAIAEKVRLKDRVLISIDLEKGTIEFSFYS
jgi:hypothetical protein